MLAAGLRVAVEAILSDGKMELVIPRGVGGVLSGMESASSPLCSRSSKLSVGTSNLTV